MASVKTTVSLKKQLFDQVEALAEEMGVARSQLFALALEEFVQRRENKRLVEQINAAYEDGLDADEKATLDQMLLLHREILEDE